MESKVKVSVIIPVYNAEKHLNQCLDSVIAQTLEEIEIICVNDGSTDKSLEILQEYAEKNDNIKVISQENMRAGRARNNGLKCAQGEYLVCWDSDDYFLPDALETMYTQAIEDEADLVVCEGRHYYESKKYETLSDSYITKSYLPEQIPFNIDTNNKYILNFTKVHPWNKMYKRELISGNNLEFLSTDFAEDIPFVIGALCCAKRITIVKRPLIVYRVEDEGSLSGQLGKKPRIPIENWILTKKMLEEKGCYPAQSFANTVLLRLPHILRNITDYDVFCDMVNYLKTEALDLLDMNDKDDAYWYVAWRAEFIKRLKEDTTEQFLMYLSNLSFVQSEERTASINVAKEQKNRKVESLEKKINTLEKEKKELKESWSYRVGNKIIYLPSKIKKLKNK